MKHQKEWRTCDRCGKEIIRYNKERAYIKTEEVKPFHALHRSNAADASNGDEKGIGHTQLSVPYKIILNEGIE